MSQNYQMKSTKWKTQFLVSKYHLCWGWWVTFKISFCLCVMKDILCGHQTLKEHNLAQSRSLRVWVRVGGLCEWQWNRIIARKCPSADNTEPTRFILSTNFKCVLVMGVEEVGRKKAIHNSSWDREADGELFVEG